MKTSKTRNINGSPRYILTDQEGSVVAVLNYSGGVMGNQRYMPFGAVRPDLTGTAQTNQRAMNNLGLMDYNAKFDDPEN